MSAKIEIVEGVYKIRGQDTSMAGYTFELVEGFRKTDDGTGYVTVDGASIEPAGSVAVPDRKIRIRCQGPASYRVVSGTVPARILPKEKDGVVSFEQDKVPDAAVAHESDEDIIERLRGRFEILTDMTKAVNNHRVSGSD